jgi:hypothetical protein
LKKIGFLSFRHWTPSSQSQTRSAVRGRQPLLEIAQDDFAENSDWNMLPLADALALLMAASAAKTHEVNRTRRRWLTSKPEQR